MSSAFWLTGIGQDPAMRDTFTPGQGEVMRGHPLCVPHAIDWDDGDPVVCDAECESPLTCVIVDGLAGCGLACDPEDDMPCEVGECGPDDRGTYSCL
jgi:hypothetical protein